MATNIREIQLKYNTQQKCLNLLEQLRWGKTITCPYCDENKIRIVDPLKKRYFCKSCNEQLYKHIRQILNSKLICFLKNPILQFKNEQYETIKIKRLSIFYFWFIFNNNQPIF